MISRESVFIAFLNTTPMCSGNLELITNAYNPCIFVPHVKNLKFLSEAFWKTRWEECIDWTRPSIFGRSLVGDVLLSLDVHFESLSHQKWQELGNIQKAHRLSVCSSGEIQGKMKFLHIKSEELVNWSQKDISYAQKSPFSLSFISLFLFLYQVLFDSVSTSVTRKNHDSLSIIPYLFHVISAFKLLPLWGIPCLLPQFTPAELVTVLLLWNNTRTKSTQKKSV